MSVLPYCRISLLNERLSESTSKQSVEQDVAEDLLHPVRPVGIDGQEGWNERARLFLYPPTFAFTELANAVKYRYTVTDETNAQHVFEADRPTASLAPVWSCLPTGWTTVDVVGIDGAGTSLGIAGSRRFWKKCAFRPGSYLPAKRAYGAAADLAYDNVFHSKQVRCLAETGDIDRTYPHNCYPAKMVSAVVEAMTHCAARDPARRDAMLGIARHAADWLIAQSIAAPSALAGFPPTYEYHEEAAGFEAPARIAKERADISMNIYPAVVGRAYLKLYQTTRDEKYLDAAKKIADRYLVLQGEDGSWWLEQRISDGQPVGSSRVLPIETIIPMLETLASISGEGKYRGSADSAFAFIERGPLADWNWQGQFEDTPAAAKFMNLTKHGACSTAIYLLRRFPNEKHRLAQARELLRFAEDQFVFWERPYTAESEPKEGFTRNRPWEGGWHCPSVTEQYSCYRPIDASSAKLIRTYLALHQAEGRETDLAKARALGDLVTRMQRDDGFIPTFFVDDAACANDNWQNCMIATAVALEQLGQRDREVSEFTS